MLPSISCMHHRLRKDSIDTHSSADVELLMNMRRAYIPAARARSRSELAAFARSLSTSEEESSQCTSDMSDRQAPNFYISPSALPSSDTCYDCDVESSPTQVSDDGSGSGYEDYSYTMDTVDTSSVSEFSPTNRFWRVSSPTLGSTYREREATLSPIAEEQRSFDSRVGDSHSYFAPHHLKRSRSSFEHHFNKRVKTSSFASVSSSANDWADKTATMRRAESLKSTNTDEDAHLPTQTVLGALALNEFPSPGSDWVPTAPSSPAIEVAPVKLKPAYRVIRSSQLPLPVPAIAPPPDHGWSPPMTPENAAKLRLKRFIERDLMLRSKQLGPSKPNTDWEDRLGLGSRRRKKVIKWILEVVPRVLEDDDDDDDDDDEASRDLEDQLMTSPETRFHAAHMFLRYFARMNLDDFGEDDDIQMFVTWDLALGALALSVKIHRDFLEPLKPVKAIDFILLASHDVQFSDFENAQKDLFDAFTHNLGDTPQGLIDDVWRALPSLRELHPKSWWNAVQREVWSLLFDALLKPDVLRYPLHHLTAGALSQAIFNTLLRRYELEEEWWHVANPRRSRGEEWRDRAKEEAEGVILDIEEALEIKNTELGNCLAWMSR